GCGCRARHAHSLRPPGRRPFSFGDRRMSFITPVPASVLAVLAMGAPDFGFILNEADPDPTIELLQARLADVHEQSKVILPQAPAEKRDLNAEEQTAIDNFTAEFERLEAQINRRKLINSHGTRMGTGDGRKVQPAPTPGDVDAG